MKKKFLLTLLATVCALCCAFGLAACNDKPENKVNGLLVAKAGEQPKDTSTALLLETSYGVAPDLDYKLYVSYTNGDKKEIALDDSKLKVEYYYYEYNSEGDVAIDELPDELLAGYYSIKYFYDGNTKHKAVVGITVNRAESGSFSVQLENPVLYTDENVSWATLKNPKGSAVQLADGLSDELISNDSNGEYYLRYVEKSVYDGFTAAQKSDYEFLHDNTDVLYYAPEMSIETVGDYVLFALVEKTHNYSHVVTPAVQFTVNDPFIERTFICQSVVLIDADGNIITDENIEYVGMAQSFNDGNQGKTVICKANGELRGTVDFGDVAFDELPDDDVYTYEILPNGIMNVNRKDGTRIGVGKKTGNTFALRLVLDEEYYFLATFTC